MVVPANIIDFLMNVIFKAHMDETDAQGNPFQNVAGYHAGISHFKIKPAAPSQKNRLLNITLNVYKHFNNLHPRSFPNSKKTTAFVPDS
jgi:hypothetical protein